jgi:hypothetical protein
LGESKIHRPAIKLTLKGAFIVGFCSAVLLFSGERPNPESCPDSEQVEDQLFTYLKIALILFRCHRKCQGDLTLALVAACVASFRLFTRVGQSSDKVESLLGHVIAIAC